MIRRRLLLVLLLIVVGGAVFAQSQDDFLIPSGRTPAIGGIHRALNDDITTLFANPAGLHGLDPGFVYSQLGFAATGPIFTIAGIVAESISGGDFVALLASPTVQTLLSSIYTRLSVGGPFYFGYAGGGMGFGIFNDTQITLESQGASSIEVRAGERFVLRGGYGINIPLPETWNSEFVVGLGLKGFVRGDAVISTSILTLPSLFDSIGLSTLTGAPFELITGIGVDVGLRYEWRNLLAAAITVDNAYAPTAVSSYTTLQAFLDSTETVASPDYTALPQEISVGFAFTPSLGPVDRYVQDLMILLDYEDILDFWLNPNGGENIVLKFGAGLEFKLLEVLSIRAGFNEGLFAAGLGVDLTFVQLNAAMYGTELSSEPGLRPAYNLVLGLEFGG